MQNSNLAATYLTRPVTISLQAAGRSADNWLPKFVFFYFVGYWINVFFLPVKKLGASISADEVAWVLLWIPAFYGFRSLLAKSEPMLLAFVGFFAMAILSSIAAGLGSLPGPYPILAPLLGIGFDTKPFVFAFAFYYVLIKENNPRETLNQFLGIVLIVAVINSFFALYDLVSARVDSLTGIPIMYANGITRTPNGLFSQKTPSAMLTLFGALVALARYRNRQSLNYLILLGYLSLCLVLHRSVKELASLGVAYLLYVSFPGVAKGSRSSMNEFLTRTIQILIVITVGIGVLISLSGSIFSDVSARYQNYATESSLRGDLYKASVQIAADYFPIGSGAGTFGSQPSRDVVYSPLYYKYGFAHQWGGGPTNNYFLMDTWWPKVLGEEGAFGLLAYLIWVFVALRSLWANFRECGDGLSLFLISGNISILIISSASAAFTVDVMLPFIGVIYGAALFVRNHRTRPEKTERISRATDQVGVRTVNALSETAI